MSNHAIVIKGPREAYVTEVSTPKLRSDYILVRTKAVALNPTDWKHIDFLADPGARVGCDYAGIVEDVGNAVTKDFKKGDRVCGFSHGSNAANHDDGTFQHIITAKGDLQIKIPDNLSFEEASTLGVGITTVGQGLYQSLQLPEPSNPSSTKIPLLIYGGSSATGALAIQYAKLSGLEVIVTCSAHNFEYVKSLGADAVFDYKSSSCAKDIQAYTKNDLKHVFDCISDSNSTTICVEAMSSSGGVYSNLLTVPNEKVTSINDKVENKSTIAYSAVGESIKLGPRTIPAIPEDFEFGKRFWEESRALLAAGKLKVHRPSVNEGGNGLEGVLKGLQALRDGSVSGKKLVYTL